MKEKIEQLEALKKELTAVDPQTPFLGNAINALSAAIDNLNWHEESAAKEKEEKPE